MVIKFEVRGPNARVRRQAEESGRIDPALGASRRIIRWACIDVTELANVARRLFRPRGLAPVDETAEDMRTELRGAFFMEFNLLYQILLERSREKGIALVMETLRDQQREADTYGHTYVNAAFAYPRPLGSRFNPREWGAWYCSFDPKTALHEIKFHLTRALQATGGYYDNKSRYLELLADFDADFIDIRDIDPSSLCLHPNTISRLSRGQQLGIEVRTSGDNGLGTRPVRGWSRSRTCFT
jgi:RES domain